MKRVVFASAITFVVSVLYAQKYHDAIAFDMKGNVKECTITDNRESFSSVAKYYFSQSGELLSEIDGSSEMEVYNHLRDSKGFLIGYSIKRRFGKQHVGDYEFEYNDANRIKKKTFRFYSSIGGREMTETTEYMYGEGEVFKTVSTLNSILYYIKSFDNRGNWIKRRKIIKDGINYDEQRLIVYWDNNVTPSNKLNASSTSTSANSSVKAVFHGTRVGKVYHIPEDNRDDYDLFFQCNVTIYNIKGQQVQLTAYVDGPTRGKGLYAPNGRHKTSEGNVAIGGVLNSRTDSDNTRWPHYTLTLPFSDLCLPDGTHTINVRWFAQAQGKFIGNSEFQTIHFTKQGKEITNFYVDGGEETPGF